MITGVDSGGAVELSAELLGLVRSIPELEARLARMERERDEYRKLYMLAREEIAQLKRGLTGQKAQRVPEDDGQLSLAILDLLLGDKQDEQTPTAEANTQSIPAHERRKPVRRPLPENLPRVTIEVVPPEVEHEGLDAFTVIGVDKRESAERRPASIVVVELIVSVR